MKKRFLLLLLPFLLSSKVYASELDNWADSIQYPFTNTRFYTGSTNVVGDSTTLTTGSGRIFHAPYPGSSIYVGAYGNPLTFANYVNQMLTPGYLYSYGVYHCQYQSIGLFHVYFTASTTAYNTSWAGTENNEDYSVIYRRTNTELSGYPTSSHFNHCYKEVVLFTVTYDSAWVGMAMYGSQTLSQSAWIGYDLQNVGSVNNLSASDVQNIIDNSGFATASSVNQVQRSVNQVQQELEGVQQKQQETTDAVKDVDNTLKDDNVNVEENGSFFSDFDTEDNGGISSIITAPLVAIQAMLNNQCSPLTATYKGKELSLPCGTSFWAGLGGIKTFLNVAIGGLLCYRIIVKLFKLIEGFKDPENDKVEVMNL